MTEKQEIPESELIERLRRRDPEGLARAYDRYAKLVYSLFLRITRDQSTAEDLVQELFLRLWNRATEFDPAKGALGVWIVSIARNMAIDHVRSAQSRFSARLRAIDYIDPAYLSHNPSGAESRIDNVRAVREAFAALNSNEQRVIEMAYFQGFSQSEIAKEIHEPLGTVKSWMRSALGRLRVAFQGAPKT